MITFLIMEMVIYFGAIKAGGHKAVGIHAFPIFIRAPQVQSHQNTFSSVMAISYGSYKKTPLIRTNCEKRGNFERVLYKKCKNKFII